MNPVSRLDERTSIAWLGALQCRNRQHRNTVIDGGVMPFTAVETCW
ncbi:hypothetical protein [Synechococcus sp. CC9616]|nr:hypothetical protein [Synechococcus sp. CC9616]